MITPGSLGVAALIASPALYEAFVTGSLPVADALMRFLFAVVVSVGMFAVLRGMTTNYRRAALERAEAEAEAGAVTSLDPQA
jgi:hypothetical protein